MNFAPDSKVLVQGITEPPGLIHAQLMKSYGTNVVAGISPGYGGQKVDGIPVFDMVEQALPIVGQVETTIIFVQPYLALDAALEAIAAGIQQIVIITEGIPPLDMVHLIRIAEATETLVIGPNSPGVILPGKVLLGTHPAEFYAPGPVGLLSRSSTLTYEVALQLTQAGLGQSIGIGIGSDTIVGSSFSQWLQTLDEDDNTEVIVLVGEIGSDSEEVAARYIAEAIDKPVVAYIAGRNAPRGASLVGHASALRLWYRDVIIPSQAVELGDDVGTAESKLAAFKRAKIPVAERPSQIPDLVKKALKPSSKKSSS